MTEPTPIRRHYSRQRKAEVVGIAAVEGQRETARLTGVPLTTINAWFNRDEFVQLRTEKREAVEEMFWAGIQVGLKAVVEGLTGDAKLGEKAVALGVIYDKYALLSGNVTSRSETQSITDGLPEDKRRKLRDWMDTLPADPIETVPE